MATFSAEDVDHYGGQGGGGFFSLADDGDTADIRLMYDSIDDVEGMSVHRVKVGVNNEGKEIFRYVNCLREYNDPIDKCPFCAAHIPVQAKLFIPVYDMATQEVKIWERGKTFFNKITGFCSRYPHPVSKVIQVERSGKRGDRNTTYNLWPLDDGEDPDLTVADLPEKSKILGGFVLDKSADDMDYYLAEGEFPPTDDDDDEDNASVSRPSRANNTVLERRTPSSRRTTNSEDAF